MVPLAETAREGLRYRPADLTAAEERFLDPINCRDGRAATRPATFTQRYCKTGVLEAMAVPRKKTSPMKRGMRRAHDALTAPTYVEDKESGERRRPHHVDLKTGKYRGRQILEPKSEA